jgi:hypothetical protein
VTIELDHFLTHHRTQLPWALLVVDGTLGQAPELEHVRVGTDAVGYQRERDRIGSTAIVSLAAVIDALHLCLLLLLQCLDVGFALLLRRHNSFNSCSIHCPHRRLHVAPVRQFLFRRNGYNDDSRRRLRMVYFFLRLHFSTSFERSSGYIKHADGSYPADVEPRGHGAEEGRMRRDG